MNGSMKKLAAAAVLATSVLVFAAPAMADKSDYLEMVPEQIENELTAERRVYRQTMEELKTLENGPMDKASELYRTQHEALLRRAEKSKITLDYMNEALKIRKKDYRR